jgi:hypothetical protein
MFDLCPLIMIMEVIEDICGNTKNMIRKIGKAQRRGVQLEGGRLTLTHCSLIN